MAGIDTKYKMGPNYEVHEIWNEIADILSDIPYNEDFTQQQREAVSGTKTRKKSSFFDRLFRGAPKYTESWQNDPEWDKANPVDNDSEIVANLISNFSEIIEKGKKGEKHTYEKDFYDVVQQWNVKPNRQQRELMEKEGLIGQYGLYNAFWERDWGNLSEQKEGGLARELVATLFREHPDSAASLIIPDIKIKAKRNKAHDSINDEIIKKEVINFLSNLKWR